MPSDYPSVKILNGVQPDHHNAEFAKIKDVYEDGTYEKIKGLFAGLCVEQPEIPTYTFLSGKPGSGKTLTLVSLFRARAFVDGTVIGAEYGLYLQFTDLVKQIIASFEDTHGTRTALEPYLKAKYLFIDDISKSDRILADEKIENVIFREILIDRWENKKYLFTTTNYVEKNMVRLVRSVFGDYTLSRMQASCRFVKYPDLDIRKKGVPDAKDKAQDK